MNHSFAVAVLQFFSAQCRLLILMLTVCAGLTACGSGSNPGSNDTSVPSVPANLTAQAVSHAQIDLHWSASSDTGGSGLAGYYLYRNGGPTPHATIDASSTSYSDTGLRANTTYSYTVRAFDHADNRSGPTPTVSATTPSSNSPDAIAPSIPGNPSAAAVSSSRIELSWEPSTDTGGSGLSGYRIYRDGASTEHATIIAPTTQYADTGLSAGTTYSYRIRAFDGAGNLSLASDPESATTTTSGAVSGLDAAPVNDSCMAWDRPVPASSIMLEPFTNLSFTQAVGLFQAPNNNNAWYVLEQGGLIKRFTGSNPTGVSTFINMTSRITAGGERGLLGMTFHPDFPADNRVFLSYTVNAGGQLVSRISSFTSNDNGVSLNSGSETILLSVNQPETNHNGGNIAFGNDGFLYIGLGDGGGAGDAHGDPGNGQRLTTMLGKMLRIDVDNGTPYGIPSDNPFAGQARCPAAGRGSDNCPEIYAWGFRNPWRWSFDRPTGALWVGDVGQGAWEEVNKVTRGGNYGWRCREGAHDYNSANTSGCGSAALIDPLTEYDHSLGIAVTGGFVYRGTQDTNLSGRYIFGDYGSGRIWAWIPENAGGSRQPTLLLDSDLLITSFGMANNGELYAVSPNALYHLVFQEQSAGGTAPSMLSATGCVATGDATQPAEGMIPYAINAPFWSDGAVKDRWIGLPNHTQISVQGDGDWDFPFGTVLMKNFTVGSQLVETRLFMRHPDGVWGGYSYRWNSAQTDATLVQGGAVRTLNNGQEWIYPSASDCLDCHTSAAGRSLGLETAQLNRSFTYAETGRTANELFTLNHIDLFTPPVTDPDNEPALAMPTNTAAALNSRARAYLHTNCSQCHRPDGPMPGMDFRYATPLAETQACNKLPARGDLGLGANARLIAPGSAANSIVVNRMNRRDANAMPPLASNLVDSAGVTLLTQWINTLSSCQ